MKTCTKCRETKPLEEFYRDKRSPGGRRASCRACHKAYNTANREAINAYQATYRADHHEARAKYQADYRETNREAVRRRVIECRNKYTARTDEKIAADRARLRPDGLKRCRKCRQWQEFTAFHTTRVSPDGLFSDCRTCANTRLLRIARDYWSAHGIDAATCIYCGAPMAHVDHVHPSSKGGPDEAWNLLPACVRCNCSKTNKPADVWLKSLDDPDAWLLDPLALVGATLADGTPVRITKELLP